MSQAAKAQEPSMEEILASIRRIIADDDAGKAAKPEEAPPKPVVVPQPVPSANGQNGDVDVMLADLDKPQLSTTPPPAEILDLTEAMTAPTPPAPSAATFRTIDASSDVVFTDKPAAAATHATDDKRRPSTQIADRALVSSATAAAVDSAFNSLAQTVLGTNARTLEDLVKEMLRPMLKSWLDDNLPGLVERIVRDEIERVSRGRR